MAPLLPQTKKQLKESPVCLVIAPTRELALQSAKVVEDSCEGAGLSSTCLYGGVPKMAQRDILRKVSCHVSCILSYKFI